MPWRGRIAMNITSQARAHHGLGKEFTPMTPIRILFSGMLIAAATGLVSCREPAPTAPFIPAPRMQASWAGSGGLLYCKPLPPDSVTQSIGPSGGQIRVSKHVLSILPGTLTQTVAITIVAPSDTLNRLQFQPEGLTFHKPVALTTRY